MKAVVAAPVAAAALVGSGLALAPALTGVDRGATAPIRASSLPVARDRQAASPATRTLGLSFAPEGGAAGPAVVKLADPPVLVGLAGSGRPVAYLADASSSQPVRAGERFGVWRVMAVDARGVQVRDGARLVRLKLFAPRAASLSLAGIAPAPVAAGAYSSFGDAGAPADIPPGAPGSGGPFVAPAPGTWVGPRPTPGRFVGMSASAGAAARTPYRRPPGVPPGFVPHGPGEPSKPGGDAV